LNVPIWLLGSSLFSAQLAAQLGLPFAFASHFAPGDLLDAMRIYRATFRPSATLAAPYVMAGLNVFAADDAEDARFLFTSVQQQFINLRRGRPGPLPAPVKDMDEIWSETEKANVANALSCSLVGNANDVRKGLQEFINRVKPDEIIATAQIFDHRARLRSFQILSQSSGEF
jgi:luciferase family oxidoreductase group 1